MEYHIYDVSNFLYSQRAETCAIKFGINFSGLVKLLSRIEKRDYCKHILVFDPPTNSTRRVPSNDGYKDNRDGKPRENAIMEAFLKQYEDELGVTCICIDGVEADDVIYSAAHYLAKTYKHSEIIVHSGDRDAIGCIVSDKVSVEPANDDGIKVNFTNYSSVIGRGIFVPYNLIGFYTMEYGKPSDNIPPMNTDGEVLYKAYSVLLNKKAQLSEMLYNNFVANCSEINTMKLIIKAMDISDSIRETLMQKVERVGLERIEVSHLLVFKKLSLTNLYSALFAIGSNITPKQGSVNMEEMKKYEAFFNQYQTPASSAQYSATTTTSTAGLSDVYSSSQSIPEADMSDIEDLF